MAGLIIQKLEEVRVFQKNLRQNDRIRVFSLHEHEKMYINFEKFSYYLFGEYQCLKKIHKE